MSKSIPFTTTSLKTAPYAEQGSYTIPDPSLAGFKVRVGRKKKVFMVESRIKGKKSPAVSIGCGIFSTSSKAGKNSVEVVSIQTAREKAREILALCAQGIDPRTVAGEPCPTFRDAVAEYLKSRPGILPDTESKVQRCLDSVGALADKPLTDLSVKDCVNVFLAVRSGNKRGQKRATKGGPAAAKDALGWMVTIINHAIIVFEKHEIKNTASVAVKRCSENWEKRRPFLNKEQVGPWLLLIENSRNDAEGPERAAYNALLLCLYTGLRINEALCLEWSNLAFENLNLENTKSKRSHSVFLSTQTRSVLEDAKAHGNDSPFVFPNGLKALDYAKVWKTIQDLNLDYDFGAHATRRTMASACEYLEIPYLTYKRMLNHAFQGGVTGGYVNSAFDPAAFERYFQRIGDFFQDLKLQALHPKMSKDQVVVSRMMTQFEALTKEQQRLLFDTIKPKMTPISLVA